MSRSTTTRTRVSRQQVNRTPVTRAATGHALLTPLPAAQVRARLAGIKSVAYYNPNNWTWFQFENYSHSQVATDVAAIAADGFNNVRVVIPVQDGGSQAPIFGMPTPSAAALARLDDFISTASSNGLTCHFTLFDHAPATIFTDIAGSQSWVDAVVGRYAGDSRISHMTLRNEMDGTNAQQMTWARALIPYVRGSAGGIPVTISAQNPNYCKSIIDATYGQGVPLDFFELHFYDFGRYWTAGATLSQLSAKVGGRPIFVGEIGFPTPPPISSTVQASPAPTATTFSVAPGDGAKFSANQKVLVNGSQGTIGSITADAITLTGTGFNWGAPSAGMAVYVNGTTLIPGQFNPTTAGMEAWQELFTRAVQYQCQQAGLPLAVPWIYYDETGSTADQYHYGLRHTDRTAKPALAAQQGAMNGVISDFSANNGFEAGDSVMPYLWYFLDGAGVLIAMDSANAHSGTYSVKIGPKVSGQFPKLTTHPVQAIVPGQTYTLSAWVKSDGLGTGTTQLILNYFSYNIDTDGVTNIGTFTSAAMPNTQTTWLQMSISGVAPANTAYAELYLYHSDTTGTIWWDDVTFG